MIKFKYLTLVSGAALLFMFSGCVVVPNTFVNQPHVVRSNLSLSSYTYPYYNDRPYYFLEGRYYYGGYYNSGVYHYGNRIFRQGHYYRHGHRYHKGRRYQAIQNRGDTSSRHPRRIRESHSLDRGRRYRRDRNSHKDTISNSRFSNKLVYHRSRVR